MSGARSNRSRPASLPPAAGRPARVVLFNKPYGVVCRFADERPCLRDYIPIAGVYPAGRLDAASEGLVLLTAEGALQAEIADPRHKWPKTYLVEVEGEIDAQAIARLARGVEIDGRPTRPAEVRRIPPPGDLWPRTPPVRHRASIPTSWIELTLREGRNRQVRKMTARVGYPTLRLVRVRVGPFDLGGLPPGAWREAITWTATPPTQRPVGPPRERGAGPSPAAGGRRARRVARGR